MPAYLLTRKDPLGWTLFLSQSTVSHSTKGFRDVIALRYGWTPEEILVECVCGKPFIIKHALSSQRGGFPTLRHNEVRGLTPSLLSEVCPNVAVEHALHELSGESLHIAMDGFGDPREKELTWMFGFLTFSLHPTRNHHCHHMRERRGVRIVQESQKSSWEHSHTWFCLWQEVHVPLRMQQFLTNDWPPFFLTNGNSHVVPPTPGYVSLWGFAC